MEKMHLRRDKQKVYKNKWRDREDKILVNQIQICNNGKSDKTQLVKKFTKEKIIYSE